PACAAAGQSRRLSADGYPQRAQCGAVTFQPAAANSGRDFRKRYGWTWRGAAGMTRWLKVLRAEYLREWRTAIRYPMEIGTGLIMMFLLFMGFFFGGRQIAGGQVSGEN